MIILRSILALLLVTQVAATISAIVLYRGGTLTQFSLAVVVLFCASVLSGMIQSLLELLRG